MNFNKLFSGTVPQNLNFSVLPIKHENASPSLTTTESLKHETKTLKNTIISLEKLDLSYSSHEKLSSSVSLESLKSPQNLQNLQSPENEKLDKPNDVDEKISGESNENSTETTRIGEKLKINNVVESVGYLIFPSSGYINMAFKSLLIEYSLFELFK